MIHKKVALISLIILFILSFIFFKDKIFLKTDFAKAEFVYSKSQYVLGDKKEITMSDELLYTYAAYRYLYGEDPTKINFEHPPLGKYLLGVSYAIFQNVSTINIFLYFIFLFLFYSLSKIFIKSFAFRLIALLVLLFMPIFREYAVISMLDIPLLTFTFLFFYSLFCIQSQGQQIIFSGLALGFYISTKYWFPSIFLLLLIAFIYFVNKKRLLSFVYSLIIALIIYLLSYTVYFINDPRPIDFLRFEWYRFRWWTGERTAPKFLIFSSLFLGKHKNWWAEGYTYQNYWTILWPILFLVWCVAQFFTNKKLEFKLLNLFAFLMLLFYAFGAASAGKYLLQIIPIWIISSFAFIEAFFYKLDKQYEK
ncbi:hypothetical protein GYA19_03890 [Candidatus Beckwithbacteria bacterium]|nr:hypothetical protein [Candidatus Beckwithbacteria bacterium]